MLYWAGRIVGRGDFKEERDPIRMFIVAKNDVDDAILNGDILEL